MYRLACRRLAHRFQANLYHTNDKYVSRVILRSGFPDAQTGLAAIGMPVVILVCPAPDVGHPATPFYFRS